VALTHHRSKKIRVLPGFKFTLGFTLFYLGLIVLIPLSAVFWKSSALTAQEFWQTVTMPTALASYRLTFGASFLAALVNAFFGLIVTWVLVRYNFFGKKLVDALVDLPFALPTAVAGITLAALYAKTGWIGQWLEPLGLKVANTQTGVFVALTFIGLPFIVRTVQPILEDLDPELEEAAASLGASRWQVFWRVILPMLAPALLTGFALAFARALGEYGSVIFIAGNIPLKTQITPVIIMGELDMFDYSKATAIALVMLVASFVLLLSVNVLQWWTNRHNTHSLA
jgi:sulfate transport system permease protein